MKARATLVRRNPILARAVASGAVVLVTAVLLAICAPDVAPDLVVSIVSFGWPLLLGLTTAWAAYVRPRRTAVDVEVVSGELRVDGAVLRAAGTLSRGQATVLAEDCVRVELLAGRRERVRLEVRETGAARAMLAALGFDRRAGTTKFRVHRLREYAGLLLLAAFAAVPISLVLGTMNIYLGLMVLGLGLLGPVVDHIRSRVEVTIGADGIDIRSPFGRTFLAHARIRSIERIVPGQRNKHAAQRLDIDAYGFDIELDDDSYFRIDTRPEQLRAGVSNTDRAFEAALAAWTTWKDGGATAPAHAATLLARGTQTTNEWIGTLRGLARDGGSGYRVAALDEHALFAVLVDAEAPRELRGAAAIVLAANADHLPRLRVVADDVADPVVRRIAMSSVDPERSQELLSADLDEASPKLGQRASTRGPS